MEPTRETRLNKRKPVSVKVEFKGLKKNFEAFTGNLSLGGMFITTKEPLKVSEKTFFRIKNGSNPVQFNLEGEVVWNNGRGCKTNRKDLPSGMGVKFLDSRILNREAIENFVIFIEESSFKVCV